ncbi:MAG: hypothetical protein RIA08_14310 [Roseovarius sp.]|uniref:hypothetical protein n=1 Tax=Roseovarius sp. TaxID=1486281 RepID=UPI0032F04345
MIDRTTLLLGLAVLGAAAVALWMVLWRPALSPEKLREAYADPAPAPSGRGLHVFHLGHSLVGRDMPAMLAQLAHEGHRYESQLGWGTSLKEHYEPGETINGFEAENDHPRFRPAREAVGSGDYDAIVFTEMVEIRDAIKYHQSGKYLARWAALARDANPETRLYLYETWHKLDDPDGWLDRLDRDIDRHWIGELLQQDLTRNTPERPVYLIPAGQVMARFVRAVEADGGTGGTGGITGRENLFQRKEDGTLDPIHINDLGAYLVALTHYAVLYQKSPVGLPHRLDRADGTPADAPTEATARLMQQIVWDVITSRPETGVPQ